MSDQSAPLMSPEALRNWMASSPGTRELPKHHPWQCYQDRDPKPVPENQPPSPSTKVMESREVIWAYVRSLLVKQAYGVTGRFLVSEFKPGIFKVVTCISEFLEELFHHSGDDSFHKHVLNVPTTFPSHVELRLMKGDAPEVKLVPVSPFLREFRSPDHGSGIYDVRSDLFFPYCAHIEWQSIAGVHPVPGTEIVTITEVDGTMLCHPHENMAGQIVWTKVDSSDIDDSDIVVTESPRVRSWLLDKTTERFTMEPSSMHELGLSNITDACVAHVDGAWYRATEAAFWFNISVAEIDELFQAHLMSPEETFRAWAAFGRLLFSLEIHWSTVIVLDGDREAGVARLKHKLNQIFPLAFRIPVRSDSRSTRKLLCKGSGLSLCTGENLSPQEWVEAQPHPHVLCLSEPSDAWYDHPTALSNAWTISLPEAIDPGLSKRISDTNVSNFVRKAALAFRRFVARQESRPVDDAGELLSKRVCVAP